MLHLRVEQNRNRRIEIQKGILIFACLKDKMLPCADPIGAAHGRHLRTGQNGRIRPRIHKNLRTHGGTGAFPVHAGNADAIPVSGHQIPKIIRTGNQRNPTFKRAQVLRIVQ